ncbi:unnamed protein product [Rotaria sp. Silwood2]|nr:unnamed protein product [Rotaria sp. Silwood2]CAF2504885.1 unnamed protein product [Rotaria sp. Silwood2]CAF2735996.1 unnamed protein product [Rotaria sp. Silwood2]CAF2903252.1 unnamed protein product [Rotaria sp. Silwood2]CAF3956291.1 unnamed protein product [Rotaria sp. Silwood2]
MPVWKINCLKSEDGTNPSILSSTTIDETNKIGYIPSSIDHQNSAVTTFDTHSLPSTPSSIIRREQKQRYYQHSPIRKFSWIIIGFFLVFLYVNLDYHLKEEY